MMSWHFTRLLGILRIATQIVWRNLEPGSKNQCHRSQFFSELRSQYKNKIAMSRFQNKLTNSRSNFTSFSCYVASNHRMYAACTRAAVIFSAAGRSENLEGGHCVLKWGFMRTFSGNQDATLKCMSKLTFQRFC